MRDVQVDDVLPVVGAGLEHLARLDGGVHAELRQRPAHEGTVAGQDGQPRRHRVPRLQDPAHGRDGAAEGGAQVEHLGVGCDEGGEGGALGSGQCGQREGSGEECGRGFRFHGHVLLIAMALMWTALRDQGNQFRG